MARLEWGTGPRPYTAGVDRGVLYLPGQAGIPWNGLVSAVEQSSGGSVAPVYFEGLRVGNVRESEEFALNVSAYTYPDEFQKYSGLDGVKDQQKHLYFGMSFRTGDSVTGKIHLIYDALAKPTTKRWRSKSQSSNVELFSWEFTTRPITLSGFRPTTHLVIDLATTSSEAALAINNALYGTTTTNAKLPSLAEIFLIFEVAAPFSVLDNGDGTWTATGDAANIQLLANGRVTISADTVVQINSTTYQMSTGF